MKEKIKPRLPVVICDPGCRDKRGHHYEFNNFLQEEVEISECLTNIHSKVPDYNKVFYHSPYSIVPAEHKQTYQEQIAADAALIAELSTNKICIIQHASLLLIQALHTLGQCCWENIVIPFPQSPASGFAEIKPKLQMCYDRWFKPEFGSTKPYFYFPRSRVWFEKASIADLEENTILFLGSKRPEKAYEAFLKYAHDENLIAKTAPPHCRRETYMENIVKAEYIWCGYGDAFAHKPSNTLLDGVCAEKKIVISKNVCLRATGYQLDKANFSKSSKYSVILLNRRRLLLASNSAFIYWIATLLT